MTQTHSSDLTRTTLAVLFIGILIAACFWVMSPFLSSLLWAAMIVIATWPLFLKLQTRLWGKRWLAVLVITIVLLLVLIVPICFAVLTILDRTDEIVGWFKSLSTVKIPPPPGWLEKIPVVGSSTVERWQHFAAVRPEELSKLLTPYATKLVGWFVSQAGNFSLLVLHFLLSIAIAAVLYAHGEKTAGGIRKFARRLAGQSGDEVAVLSAKAIRGVALGIVVTALVQSSLGWVGLFFAGVPGTVLLTAVMLILCIAQIGPSLVLIPAAIWLFYSGHPLAGSLFAVWGIFVCAINNFLQPVLIRKGVDLPMLLIITGVIGGLVAFGIIGLFIGPVILAVTFTLLCAWVSGVDSVAATEMKTEKGR
ncbi:MAG: AI-2E family transporter YdiK [Verrucomicrobia bacterium]|nr:AI-2E family transporter YdiK [Verrucomicrobiota bacterium]